MQQQESSSHQLHPALAAGVGSTLLASAVPQRRVHYAFLLQPLLCAFAQVGLSLANELLCRMLCPAQPHTAPLSLLSAATSVEESGAEIATGKPPAAELACTDKHASAEPAEFSSCTSTGEDDSGELGGAASLLR